MQCPNCKKDLVAGYECEPCKAILHPEPVVVEVPVVEKVEKATPIKKVVKKKK